MPGDPMPDDEAASRTRESFGYLWKQSAAGEVRREYESHFARVAAVLDLAVPVDGSRLLDAGCGDGLDLATIAARFPATTVVGVDFSDGVVVARAATKDLPNASVVRGSVLAPPFAPSSFEIVYSYGVLHHTPDPAGGFKALSALVRPGGRLIVYVYTDLREEPLMRVALRAVTALRRVTTRVPARLLFRLCQVGSPLVFLAFGVPARLLRHVPRGRRFAERLPFNFVRSPLGAVGDLYDRFSAPIEFRHNQPEVTGWYRSAGFTDIVVTRMPDARGWVGSGRRLASASG